MWWSSAGLVLCYSFSNRRWLGEAFGIPPSPSLLTNRSETIAIHSPRYSAASVLCWFEKRKHLSYTLMLVLYAAAFLPVRPLSLYLFFPLSLSLSLYHSLTLSLPALERQFRKCAKHVRRFKPRRVHSAPDGGACVYRQEQQRGETEGGTRGLDYKSLLGSLMDKIMSTRCL